MEVASYQRTITINRLGFATGQFAGASQRLHGGFQQRVVVGVAAQFAALGVQAL